MILPRIVTAIVGIPLMLLAVYWGGVPYFILISGVVVFSLNEFFLMAKKAGYGSRSILGIVGGYILFAAIFVSSSSFGQKADHQLVAIALTLFLAAMNIAEMLRGEVSGAVGRMGVTLYGALFIPWAFAHLGRIYYLKPHGREWVFLLFLVVWTLDTAAYFFGVRFGRRRLAPSVSPKKSVEGLAAAIVSAVILAPVFGKMLMGAYVSVVECALAGFAIAVVGQFSDLAESLIKRDADIKDSDALLPGHGGMLDRFDSFLFTSPLLYYYLIMFK